LPEFKNPQVYRYTARGAQYTSAAARSIRIRDLFMMASGYPYPDNTVETARQMAKAFEEVEKNTEPHSPFTLRDFTRKLAAIPLAFDPGTHWMYGMSHDILGAFIEVVSGKTFGQFLKDEMFDPLGMVDTSFRIAVNKRERLCSLYNRTEDGILTKNTDMDADYQPGAVFESGGGGLLSTLSDYSRLAQVLACGELDGVRLLNPNTIRLMSTNHLSTQQLADYDWPMLTGFGYGLGVRTLIDPAAGGCNSNLGEFGWGGMAGTIVIIDPKEQLSITYMQQLLPNREDYHTPRLRNVVYGAI
jgi:CubicO group peptidase (beta-lactamase class C family)